MISYQSRLIILALCLTFAGTVSAETAPESVAVAIGLNVSEIDRFAASELCGYLDKLFGIKVSPTTSLSTSAREIFLIGNPETNPLIAKKEFPDVMDQGVILKSVKLGNSSALIVGGGSPQATLWAV